MFQPSAIIDNGAKIGRGAMIWHFCHIMGKAEIGEDCTLGQNVFVGDNVIIGNNVKIQNNVSIYDGVVIEDNVFLGPSCVFTNVKKPRAQIGGQYEKTIVHQGATIGANATIVCGVEIGEYSFIGAGAVVTKDVPAYALMAGIPAKQIGWVNKNGNELGKLACLIFSKDRSMQLQATIESFLMHCEDDVEIYVLCKTSSQLHQRQYEQLQRKNQYVRFRPEDDFKAQVLAVVEQYEFVLFLVDDNIFVGDFSLANVMSVLRSNEEAIGFSLRLGRNTNYCYPKNASQKLPEFKSIGNGILKFDWTNAEYDFGYPLEVSSSVYRTKDVLPLLKKQKYDNPNMLEGILAANVKDFSKNQLLCYEQSVVFTLPINLVQTVTANRAGNNEKYSSEELAHDFDHGLKIDTNSYSGFVPASCHQEMQLDLIRTCTE